MDHPVASYRNGLEASAERRCARRRAAIAGCALAALAGPGAMAQGTAPKVGPVMPAKPVTPLTSAPDGVIEVPTARGVQRLAVDAPDLAISAARRLNHDLADKAGRVPDPTAGYGVTGRVVVRLDGREPRGLAGLAQGAFAKLNQARAAGAPGYRVIDTGSVRAAVELARRLRATPGVAEAFVESWAPTAPRTLPTDPFFFRQWHLRNSALPVADVNAEAAWALGYTGSGVTIGIVEFPWEYTHPDLAPNFFPDATQVSSEFPDPHATACAGVAAAAAFNGLGGAGAAFGARLSGQIKGSDVENAEAFGFRNDLNDIKSSSWGPLDTGFIAFMSPVERAALREGVESGRRGKGVIYVWAAGNGGTRDRVDYDPYASSRYTISVGAIGDQDRRATYNESGSSMFVVAPSDGNTRRIYTTDLTGESGYDPSDYTSEFGGTSSAAPLAAGCIALMLEANPNLTWRDVRHILVNTARQCDPTHAGWTVNGAGHRLNYNYGFGAIDAGAMVQAARAWKPVAPEVEAATAVQVVAAAIPDSQTAGVTSVIHVPDNIRLESVEVVLNVKHPYVGDLRIVLTGPSGTQSILAEQRFDPTDDYADYLFTTHRHWDESSRGDWTLNISDRAVSATGTWNDWKLIFHGTPIAACAADLNGDGIVDAADYTLFLGHYGTGGPEADLDGDGVVDFSDYLTFLNLYDGGC